MAKRSQKTETATEDATVVEQASEPETTKDVSKEVSEFQAIAGNTQHEQRVNKELDKQQTQNEQMTKEEQAAAKSGVANEPASHTAAREQAIADKAPPPPIGHNNPPAKVIDIGTGKDYVIPYNASIEPEATNTKELVAEMAVVRQAVAVLKDKSQTTAIQSIVLAVDFMLLCRNATTIEKFKTSDGEDYTITPLKLEMGNSNQRDDARKTVRNFLQKVWKYDGGQKKRVMKVAGEKGQAVHDSENPNLPYLDTVLNTAINAALLVYFGAFGMKLAYMTSPKGIVMSDEEIKSSAFPERCRRVVYDQSTIEQELQSGGNTYLAKPGVFLLASDRTINDAYQVFIGNKRFDKAGNLVKKATPRPPGSDQANAGGTAAPGLVKAADAGKTKDIVAEGMATELPGLKQALANAEKAVKASFSVRDKKSHDMTLATILARAMDALVLVIDWNSRNVQRDTDFQEAIANLNMHLSAVTTADVNQKSA